MAITRSTPDFGPRGLLSAIGTSDATPAVAAGASFQVAPGQRALVTLEVIGMSTDDVLVDRRQGLVTNDGAGAVWRPLTNAPPSATEGAMAWGADIVSSGVTVLPRVRGGASVAVTWEIRASVVYLSL